MFNYELYRRSTLGMTLTEALDELIQSQQLSPQLAIKVLMHFDSCMAEALSQRLRTRATLKGHMNTYRFCDDVWTFDLDAATIRLDDETIATRNVKIVACNANK